MGRNLVVCCDGTGNTSSDRLSNVGRLLEHLALDAPDRQLVAYDQGLGTVRSRVPGDAPTGLTRLDAPPRQAWNPSSWRRRAGGLLVGTGLRENVWQAYRWLAGNDVRPEDRLFLFGFSRGAFTVRALAGLLYRCHLPAGSADGDLAAEFAASWDLFTKVQLQQADLVTRQELRDRHRPCPVHFLGLWDTVKSYGGLRPVILPHLRHNPEVAHVRHALALDERRAWFKHTTWGLLDTDRAGALRRITEDLDGFARQDVAEVWFSGCHSDVGGGDRDATRREEASQISLRWMLRQAVDVDPGLLLAPSGHDLLSRRDDPRAIVVRQSWNRSWRLVEAVPRLEIDNSGRYPRRVGHRGSDGVRDPSLALRDGHVTVHESARGRLRDDRVRYVYSDP